MNHVLTEAIINIMDSIEENARNGQTKGVSVRDIYESLKAYHFDLNNDISYSEIFSTLCQLEGSKLFRFERADIFDIYFSLKGSKEDMLNILKEIPKRETNDINTDKYNTDYSEIVMENFNKLKSQINSAIKAQKEFVELQQENKNIQNEINLLSN